MCAIVILVYELCSINNGKTTKVRVNQNFDNQTSLNKISFKKEGLPSCSKCFNCFVRHLGTFVNASHNWYTVSPLPKRWWHITMYIWLS